MKRIEAIDILDNMDITDPEKAHAQADEILLRLAGPEVTGAYRALEDRCARWAYA